MGVGLGPTLRLRLHQHQQDPPPSSPDWWFPQVAPSESLRDPPPALRREGSEGAWAFGLADADAEAEAPWGLALALVPEGVMVSQCQV